MWGLPCEGLFAGYLQNGSYVEFYMEQTDEPGLSYVDVAVDGQQDALRGQAQCHDTGYGQTNVYMWFDDGTDAAGVIDRNGNFDGGGVMGMDFNTGLNANYSGASNRGDGADINVDLGPIHIGVDLD